MSPLETRKQLLIAESELNRAQLAEAWAAMTTDLRTFIGRARSFGTIIPATALLVTGCAALWHAHSTPADKKPSWWQTLLKPAGMISARWLAFRTKHHQQENQPPKSRV